MPASETSASVSPRRSALEDRRAHPVGVVVVIGLERLVDAVAREQPRRSPACPRTGCGRHCASTHSARSVMSPRLPIGVATRCRPGASAMRSGVQRQKCFGEARRRVYLLRGRRLGSPPASRSLCRRPPLPRWRFPRIASHSWSLSRCSGRGGGVRRGPTVPAPVASGAIAGLRAAASGAGGGGHRGPPGRQCRGRRGQGGAAGAAVRAQCRSRQGDARGGAARAVHDRQRPADPGAARHRRHRRRRRQGGALGDRARGRADPRPAARRRGRGGEAGRRATPRSTSSPFRPRPSSPAAMSS